MTTKQQIQELVDRLPDDCSFEDVQQRLYVLEKIARGTAAAERGDEYTEEQARERLSKWLVD